MQIVRDKGEMRRMCRDLRPPVGLVPTMGALHEGHLSLVRQALSRSATTVASVFVNPAQFATSTEAEGYPRDEAGDLAALERAGVAAAFAPTVDEMYPPGTVTRVSVDGPPATGFEGTSRPGHFDGVATVVVKLLEIVQPDLLFMGEKDAQQLAVVRRLIDDLDLPVDVVPVPTVREPDGLAMSSRNRLLTEDERRVAPRLHAALQEGLRTARSPDRSGQMSGQTAARTPTSARSVVDATLATLDAGAGERPRFAVDYVAVVDPETFAELDRVGGPALLIAAARLGGVRLIDNVRLDAADAGSPATPTQPERKMPDGPRDG